MSTSTVAQADAGILHDVDLSELHQSSVRIAVHSTLGCIICLTCANVGCFATGNNNSQVDLAWEHMGKQHKATILALKKKYKKAGKPQFADACCVLLRLDRQSKNYGQQQLTNFPASAPYIEQLTLHAGASFAAVPAIPGISVMTAAYACSTCNAILIGESAAKRHEKDYVGHAYQSGTFSFQYWRGNGRGVRPMPVSVSSHSHTAVRPVAKQSTFATTVAAFSAIALSHELNEAEQAARKTALEDCLGFDQVLSRDVAARLSLLPCCRCLSSLKKDLQRYLEGHINAVCDMLNTGSLGPEWCQKLMYDRQKSLHQEHGTMYFKAVQNAATRKAYAFEMVFLLLFVCVASNDSLKDQVVRELASTKMEHNPGSGAAAADSDDESIVEDTAMLLAGASSAVSIVNGQENKRLREALSNAMSADPHSIFDKAFVTAARRLLMARAAPQANQQEVSGLVFDLAAAILKRSVDTKNDIVRRFVVLRNTKPDLGRRAPASMTSGIAALQYWWRGIIATEIITSKDESSEDCYNSWAATSTQLVADFARGNECTRKSLTTFGFLYHMSNKITATADQQHIPKVSYLSNNTLQVVRTGATISICQIGEMVRTWTIKAQSNIDFLLQRLGEEHVSLPPLAELCDSMRSNEGPGTSLFTHDFPANAALRSVRQNFVDSARANPGFNLAGFRQWFLQTAEETASLLFCALVLSIGPGGRGTTFAAMKLETDIHGPRSLFVVDGHLVWICRYSKNRGRTQRDCLLGPYAAAPMVQEQLYRYFALVRPLEALVQMFLAKQPLLDYSIMAWCQNGKSLDSPALCRMFSRLTMDYHGGTVGIGIGDFRHICQCWARDDPELFTPLVMDHQATSLVNQQLDHSNMTGMAYGNATETNAPFRPQDEKLFRQRIGVALYWHSKIGLGNVLLKTDGASNVQRDARHTEVPRAPVNVSSPLKDCLIQHNELAASVPVADDTACQIQSAFANLLKSSVGMGIRSGLQAELVSRMSTCSGHVFFMGATASGKSLVSVLMPEAEQRVCPQLQWVTVIVYTTIASLHAAEMKLEKRKISYVRYSLALVAASVTAPLVLLQLEDCDGEGTGSFLGSLRAANRLRRLVFDEAHLLFDHHGFRHCIGSIQKLLGDGTIQVVALTGTLRQRDEKSLAKILGLDIKNVACVRESGLTPHACLSMERVPYKDVASHVVRLCSNWVACARAQHFKKSRMIVFCATRKQQEYLGARICASVNTQVYLYDSQGSYSERVDTEETWASQDFSIMVGTPAFAAGVDYPYVNCIVFAYAAGDMCTIVQGIGRGGRNTSSPHYNVHFLFSHDESELRTEMGKGYENMEGDARYFTFKCNGCLRYHLSQVTGPPISCAIERPGIGGTTAELCGNCNLTQTVSSPNTTRAATVSQDADIGTDAGGCPPLTVNPYANRKPPAKSTVAVSQLRNDFPTPSAAQGRKPPAKSTVAVSQLRNDFPTPSAGQGPNPNSSRKRKAMETPTVLPPLRSDSVLTPSVAQDAGNGYVLASCGHARPMNVTEKALESMRYARDTLIQRASASQLCPVLFVDTKESKYWHTDKHCTRCRAMCYRCATIGCQNAKCPVSKETVSTTIREAAGGTGSERCLECLEFQSVCMGPRNCRNHCLHFASFVFRSTMRLIANASPRRPPATVQSGPPALFLQAPRIMEDIGVSAPMIARLAVDPCLAAKWLTQRQNSSSVPVTNMDIVFARMLARRKL